MRVCNRCGQPATHDGEVRDVVVYRNGQHRDGHVTLFGTEHDAVNKEPVDLCPECFNGLRLAVVGYLTAKVKPCRFPSGPAL